MPKGKSLKHLRERGRDFANFRPPTGSIILFCCSSYESQPLLLDIEGHLQAGAADFLLNPKQYLIDVALTTSCESQSYCKVKPEAHFFEKSFAHAWSLSIHSVIMPVSLAVVKSALNRFANFSSDKKRGSIDTLIQPFWSCQCIAADEPC